MARAKPRSRRRRSPVPRLLATAALVLAGFLYYRPVQAYVQTRHQLHARQAEVQRLRADHAALARQLAHGASKTALERQARRLGYVKPGEKLTIVKGIDGWRAARARKQQ